MANSSELNKLYFDILVSKNKLPLLQTYYTNIKNEILTDLTELYNYILSAQSWVDSQIAYLNTTRTEQSTEVNNFVASSTDALIVTHPKYQEMLEKYQSYVTEFYSRMHALEDASIANSYTVDNFVKNEIGQISSYWKFHYSTRYDDATNVEHKFCTLNMTSESDLLELSNNRFIYTTNENVVYDVDYNTKDVYILYLDRAIDQTLDANAKYNTLFTLPDSGKFYAIVRNGTLSTTEASALATASIVGGSASSTVYKYEIYEYDSDNHVFNKLTSNTSTIYSNDPDTKFRIMDNAAINDFYYAFIGSNIIRIKISGSSSENTDPYVQTYNNEIVDIVYFNDYFVFPQMTEAGNKTRLVACKQTSTGLISTAISASVTLNSFAENDSRYNTDNQIITIFKATNVGGEGGSAIYVVTNTNIWYISNVGNSSTIGVVKDNRKTTIGLSDYSFLDNKGSYLIDELGYFYILKDKTYIYSAKTDSSGTDLYGNVVQAPTRYADKLLNLVSADSDDTSGYAYNVGTDITSYQNGSTGLQDFIYSFIKDGVLYCITKTGRIAYCNISTGKWNSNDSSEYCLSSFTGDKEITAICDGEEEGDLFIALANYTILKISQDELISNNGANITTSSKYVVYNTNSGSRINALLYIAKYKTLYIGDNSGYVSAYDFNGNLYHTCDTTHKDYNESDKSKYAITKGDKAIGNVSINCLTTDGNNLIVMGDYGRVSSCSFSTYEWTPYNTSEDSISQYSSNLYFNGNYTDSEGTVHTCGNIVSFINYNNSKLIVFTYEGEVFSCNLATGVWTDPLGKIVLHNGSGFGPGIYNLGTILGKDHVPYAVTRIGTTIFVTGESGRIASINIATGGITICTGINGGAETGPGYSYTGEDIAETNNIYSIITDSNGKLYLSGTNNVVLTFSVEGNEALIPTNDKLYYVSRRQTKYDYLSSLLVRLTKTELTEKVPLYPPSEDDEIFELGYRSAAYVFKNGKYIRRLSATLDIAYYSDDTGSNYTTVTNIDGSDLLPLAGTSTTAYAYVTSMPRGVVTSEGESFIALNIGQEPYTYLLYTDTEHNFKWFKLSTQFTQTELDGIRYIGNNSIFIGGYELTITNGELTETSNAAVAEAYNETEDVLFKLKDDNVFYYRESGSTSDTKLVSIDDLFTYMKNVITDTSVLSFGKYCIFAGPNNTLFVTLQNDTDWYLVQVHYDDSGLLISHTVLNANVSNIFSNVDGTKTFLIGSKAIQVVNADSYGKYISTDVKTITEFDSTIEEFAYDPTDAKIYVAVYDTAENNGLITHTNSIHSFKDYNGLQHTPIRAISDAWNTIQFTLGNGSSDTVPNAVCLKLKFKNSSDDKDVDTVSKNYSLRYRVLISNITDGKFILYETEKTIGMSKTDDETGTIEPMVRVLAMDGFEDEIFELFTSKLDSNHNVYSDSSKNNFNESGYSLDFLTFIQRFTGSDEAVYQIKINPLSTLPNDIDAKFFVELYNQDATAKNGATYINNIDLSEYKTSDNNTDANVAFGSVIDKIITYSEIDGSVNKPASSNVDHKVQISDNNEYTNVSADTYISIIRGNGLGLYDKINCVLMYVDGNYHLLPLSKNKKDLRYVFDYDGSKAILDNTDYSLDAITNGRTVHKMHDYSVFSKNVVNNPNYYVDYNSKSRIVNVEGTMVNRYGLFESISTLDGNQKRIKQISEVRDGDIWRNSNSAYDLIKPREYGYGFDIVDKYSKFEAPYDAIRAWWIPAKGNITKGNERLLSYTYADGNNDATVGRKYSPSDTIPSVTVSEKVYAGGSNPTDNGITSAINGYSASDSVEAYTELVDEKFPLENWEGFDWAKMCFIRKWRVVYTDKHIKYYYDVEAPSEVTVATDGTVTLKGSTIIRLDSIPYTTAEFATTDMVKILAAIKPSIKSQLYYYTDINNSSSNEDRDEYEGISTETWRRGTAWYYTSHAWKVYLDEHISLDHPNFFTGKTENDYYLENKNLGRTSASDFETWLKDPTITKTWYVTDSTDTVNTDNTNLLHHDAKYELDNGQEVPLFLASVNTTDSKILTSNFPVADSVDGEVVGERIVNITIPTTTTVTKVDAWNTNLSWDDITQTNESTSLFTSFNIGVVKSDLALGGKLSSGTFGYNYNISKTTDFLDNSKELVEDSEIYSYSSDTDDSKYFIKPESSNSSNAYAGVKLSSSSDGATITGKDGVTKSSSVDNTFSFKYGVGGIYPMYAGEGFGTTRTSHTIKVTIRSYNTITNSDNESNGWFVNYTDTTYTVVIAATSGNILSITSNDSSSKVTIASTAGSSTTAILDGYAGRSLLKYLYKKPITLTVNSLKKDEGYTSVHIDLLLWSINDASIASATSESIANLLESTDDAFDINKYRNTLYADRFSFLTLNKDQSIADITDSSIVDRVFVKQFFTNEKTTDETITWSDYVSLYSKTIDTFADRTENTYPQTYNYLEFNNNSILGVLKSDTCQSDYCWLVLEDGIAANTNLLITGDSSVESQHMNYYVAGTFKFAWHDGTTKSITFTTNDGITLQNLYDKGFITSVSDPVETTTRHESDDYYDKTCSISVVCPVLSMGSLGVKWNYVNKTSTLFATAVVEYTETTDTLGNTTYSKATTWYSDDESTSTTGLENTTTASNTTYTVTYNLTNMHPSGLNATSTETVNRNDAYSKILVADDGYDLPDTISVQIGSTGTVTTDKYSYDRSYSDSTSYIYNTAKTVSAICDDISTDKDGYTFIGFSLDGENVLTDTEKNTTISANTSVTIYRLYNNNNEARLTIPGEYVTDNISIIAVAVVES